MKLSTTEEYGLRCLLQVARRAPAGGQSLASIKDVAEAEGLSPDYVAKLLGLLRRAELLESERGAAGGYRMARAAGALTVREVLMALDSPFYGQGFCDGHSGKAEACVHKGRDCSLTPLWQRVNAVLEEVLSGITLDDLLTGDQAPLEVAHG